MNIKLLYIVTYPVARMHAHCVHTTTTTQHYFFARRWTSLAVVSPCLRPDFEFSDATSSTISSPAVAACGGMERSSREGLGLFVCLFVCWVSHSQDFFFLGINATCRGRMMRVHPRK
jgi:hypothetical protein